MPLRLKEVHFVNQPFMFNMVWQMCKPFVKDKLKKRVTTSLFFVFCRATSKACKHFLGTCLCTSLYECSSLIQCKKVFIRHINYNLI
jgi:hypothetical protein